jgi:cobalt-zinc-cadmium efflux system membrane fusion protein
VIVAVVATGALCFLADAYLVNYVESWWRSGTEAVSANAKTDSSDLKTRTVGHAPSVETASASGLARGGLVSDS